jgi:hypothetical protein
MACNECEKCWLNYIEDCKGQENYSEKACKKKKREEN